MALNLKGTEKRSLLSISLKQSPWVFGVCINYKNMKPGICAGCSWPLTRLFLPIQVQFLQNCMRRRSCWLFLVQLARGFLTCVFSIQATIRCGSLCVFDTILGARSGCGISYLLHSIYTIADYELEHKVQSKSNFVSFLATKYSRANQLQRLIEGLPK